MNRIEVAEVLEEIAVLLELQGDNPFKVRAYQSGARLVETMTEEDFRVHSTVGDWRTVRGVGDALADKIQTLALEGRLEFHQKLLAAVPPGLLDLLEIPGLGPKKARALHEKLGIDSIEALRLACQEGRVADLSGFGVKTQEKLLIGIERLAEYSKRHYWWHAEATARPILEGLRQVPGVVRADLAGSLRRCMETVGDIDFVASSDTPGPVMDWFCTRPGILEVTGRGETKSSVRLEGGLQADLRVVPDAQYPFALHHFTGSKEHNILMRQRALAKGWSLSEWGLTVKEPGLGVEAPPQIRDEAGLFASLGMAYVPPELREGLSEIEAAQGGAIPRLIELKNLKGAFHNHTTESDGKASLAEMAAEAERLGWEYLGIADHSKSSVQAKGLNEVRLAAQIACIKEWNTARRSRTVLLSGTECDILTDGSLDFDEATRRSLDYVVLSVHNAITQDEETMTRRIIRAIESPCVHILGHLTGRLLLRREGYTVDVAKIIDAAIANGVIIELNANIRRLDMDWRHWRRAAERGLLCAINPDAHDTASLSYVRAGINSARKGWLREEHVLNTRSLDEVRAFFARKR